MKVVYTLVLLGTLSLFACSNAEQKAANQKANKLYVEASKLFESEDYKEALAKLEIILETYPKSDMAVSLASGKTKIGEFTLQKFKKEFLPSYTTAISLKQIGMALDMYAADNGQYPTTEQGLDALIRKPTSPPEPFNWNDAYVKPTKFLDPWGKPYQYRSPSQHEGYEYDLYSYGQDGIEGGGNDITSWH